MVRRTQDEQFLAKDIAKKIIDAISACKYAEILNYVDKMNSWTAELLAEVIENYKRDNDLKCIDNYESACNFYVVYKDGSHYKQEIFYFLDDGSGFKYDYALTTNNELNDLTMMLGFTYKGDFIEVSFEDLHVC